MNCQVGASPSPPTAPEVRTIWNSLPGRAVSAAALVNGTLWIIVDPDKFPTASALAKNLAFMVAGGGS